MELEAAARSFCPSSGAEAEAVAAVAAWAFRHLPIENVLLRGHRPLSFPPCLVSAQVGTAIIAYRKQRYITRLMFYTTVARLKNDRFPGFEPAGSVSGGGRFGSRAHVRPWRLTATLRLHNESRAPRLLPLPAP